MAEAEKMPKDLKEQVEEKKKPGIENPAEVTETNELGEFYAVEYQREHENDGEVRGNILEQEFETPYSIQMYPGKTGKDGVRYDKYAVTFGTMRNGKPIPMKFFVQPGDGRSSSNKLANEVFDGAEKMRIYVVRTLTSRSVMGRSVDNVRYSLKCYSEDDYGTRIGCPFNAIEAGDRAIFQNFINLLVKRELIK